MDAEDEGVFAEFVAARSAALLRTAFLLVGDRDRAQDLVQTALVKTFLSWSRIRDVGALEGYVRRVMATTATSWWRRRMSREWPTAEIPDPVAPDHLGEALARTAIWRRLMTLPVKQRAVLVLRFYEDLSEAEIAQTLGISRGTVKSHTSRALAALRERLGDDSDYAEVAR